MTATLKTGDVTRVQAYNADGKPVAAAVRYSDISGRGWEIFPKPGVGPDLFRTILQAERALRKIFGVVRLERERS